MTKLDPITVEVIHNYFLSAAREMERNLMRTSYSTVIYEIRDFGLGIYDKHCRMLAEAPGLAVFTRGNDYGLQKTVDFIGEENMEPGDLMLTSYPYWSSAHPLDVLAVSPSSRRATWSDIQPSSNTGSIWGKKTPATSWIPPTSSKKACSCPARRSIKPEYWIKKW